jgi:hypothetical protein
MNSITENQLVEKTKKQQFIENVQRWVLIDTQLKIVNEKTRKLRELKNTSNQEICNYMNENNLSNNKIGITGGELKIYEKKEYSPLTFGYIEKCLAEIIPNASNVKFIMTHLKDKREIKITQDIRRYSKNNENLIEE